MREKLNESQAAQVGLVAILVLVAIVIFMKSSGGGEEEAEPAAAPEAVEASVSGLETGIAATGTAEVPTSIPAPPPPREFTAAYDSGQTVVLLVVHNGGIDDKLAARAAGAIEGMSGVTLIRVPLKQLPRYASVTVGLALNRMPALVVMRPQKLSHGVPQATVDYGFQTTATMAQAVRDAAYKGPEASYHPD